DLRLARTGFDDAVECTTEQATGTVRHGGLLATIFVSHPICMLRCSMDQIHRCMAAMQALHSGEAQLPRRHPRACGEDLVRGSIDVDGGCQTLPCPFAREVPRGRAE